MMLQAYGSPKTFLEMVRTGSLCDVRGQRKVPNGKLSVELAIECLMLPTQDAWMRYSKPPTEDYVRVKTAGEVMRRITARFKEKRRALSTETKRVRKAGHHDQR